MAGLVCEQLGAGQHARAGDLNALGFAMADERQGTAGALAQGDDDATTV